MGEFQFRENKDGTVTLMNGRQRINVDRRGKTDSEFIDAVRWAAIGIGVKVDPSVAARIEKLREDEGRVI